MSWGNYGSWWQLLDITLRDIWTAKVNVSLKTPTGGVETSAYPSQNHVKVTIRHSNTDHEDDLSGSCPDNFYNCGARCRQLDNNPYWKLCGEECIFRDEPCEGRCPSDLFRCGEKCESRELLEHFAWRGCGSECLPPITACKGICPSGYQVDQEKHCIKMELGPWVLVEDEKHHENWNYGCFYIP
jgi:hypothetical protein